MIFNSVAELQTRKFQIKPDKLNGFEILSDCDASLERQQELVTNIKTPSRQEERGGIQHQSSYCIELKLQLLH